MKKVEINVFNINEFIQFINKYNKFYNFNINTNNTQYINKLQQLFNENKIYGSQEIIDILLNYLRNITNKHKNTTFLYWNVRGYSFDEYKNFILNKYKKTVVYFNKDDIFNSFIKDNKYSFNLNNISFIKKFINFITFSDFITERDINDQLMIWCKQYYPDKQNKGYIKSSKAFYMARGYSETEAETIIRESNKNRSPRCVEYWLNKGYTLEDAKIEVNKVQANNVSYSKSTTKYWLNLGLNIEDAKKKASYYAKEHSVWTFNYWKKLGYSDDEAKLKVHEINPSCEEYKGYKSYEDYLKKKELQSNLAKNIWKNWKHSDNFLCKIKGGWMTNISESENKCFDFLQKYIDKKIIHKPYIVIIPDEISDKTRNKVFYACDGYLEYKGKIIIFEYDGGQGVFHQEDLDKQRDNDILLIDNNVLGIVRISETVFKYLEYKKIIQYINDEVQKVKDCKEDIVRIK